MLFGFGTIECMDAKTKTKNNKKLQQQMEKRKFT